VLGWIAERLPNLVREIHSRGHEVASHGYGHELCSQSSIDDLKEDLAKSKKLLEDIIGERVYGYRAPSFSISDEILKLIEEAGYEYDSSYNSFGMHGRYGKISLNGNRSSGIAILLNQKSTIENRKFYELPISNLPLFPFPTLGNLAEGPVVDPAEGPEHGRREHGRRGTLAHFRHFSLPWGGGAYFRLIPAPLFRIGVREILKQQHAYLFYMHPWEVDPEQPRPEGTTAFSRFKHYTNLSKTEGKLRSLLRKFSECRFVSCHEHLQPK
jgi:peptidoglycan/xylan/chitin deacetylase (PgdA/CDA1 family)